MTSATDHSTDAWSIAIFAHNEADHVIACLNSLYVAAEGHAFSCYVLANGCQDQTEATVRSYALSHPEVHLVSIALGDKSNAWNEYVHRLAPNADVHFFVDGDVEACEGALRMLSDALRNDGKANAAAALPTSGRNRDSARQAIITDKELAGNLYALRGSFVERVRLLGIRLPFGLIGDDSLVAALAKWNLDPETGWDNERVVPCPIAGFRFFSLSPWRRSHWKIYFNRRVRYRIRAMQIKALRPIIRARGIQDMPKEIRECYPDIVSKYRFAWNGLDTLFDMIAIRRIRNVISR